MLTMPSGNKATTVDRLMLLAMWARHLQSQLHKHNSHTTPYPIIFAGLGKPTFPINRQTTEAASRYWAHLNALSKSAQSVLEDDNIAPPRKRDLIANLGCASDYGDPQGEPAARTQMASALNNWYQQTIFTADDILFTVGGAAALHNIFQVINRLYPNCRIITPFPHYSLYTGPNNQNHLHPIDVMRLPGYRLTPAALEEAIIEAKVLAENDQAQPKAFVLCDPNNPLGTVLRKNEAEGIAEVLRRHPELLIVLDEAYAELCINGTAHWSLLRVAPDLKNRIILMRSATKALSAAGERMAVAVAFDPTLMSELVQENIGLCGHAPKSLQFAFATAMNNLDEQELRALADHYRPQLELVSHRLIELGADMPDPTYQVEGTFYILTDLSDLFGLPLPQPCQQVLNKQGVIETDEDIAYYLLFTDGIMITPFSYFGSDPSLGYLRITCSCGDSQLETLTHRLEKRLIQARAFKQAKLNQSLEKLKQQFSDEYKAFSNEINNERHKHHHLASQALQLKLVNSKLQKIIHALEANLAPTVA